MSEAALFQTLKLVEPVDLLRSVPYFARGSRAKAPAAVNLFVPKVPSGGYQVVMEWCANDRLP